MAARAIREAPELYGQEEVLARGRVLAVGDLALAAPLERLAQVYQLLCAAGPSGIADSGSRVNSAGSTITMVSSSMSLPKEWGRS